VKLMDLVIGFCTGWQVYRQPCSGGADAELEAFEVLTPNWRRLQKAPYFSI